MSGSKISVMSVEQFVNLICRNEYGTHCDIMIQRIDDQRNEFTHIGNYEIRLLKCSRWKISKVCCNYAVDIPCFIILIKLLKAFCK